MKNVIITSEKASKMTLYDAFINYYLRIDGFSQGKPEISLVKELGEYTNEGKDSKILYVRPLKKVPEEWLKGAELGIEAWFDDDGKHYVSYKTRIIKTIFITKELRPLFDEEGKPCGSVEFETTSSTYMGTEKKKTEKELKRFNSFEENPQAFAFVIMIQAEKRHVEKRVATEELRKQLEFTIKDAVLWAIPAYANGMLLGAYFEYKTSPHTSGITYGIHVLTPEEFLALPQATSVIYG